MTVRLVDPKDSVKNLRFYCVEGRNWTLATAYVWSNPTCSAPVTSRKDLKALIEYLSLRAIVHNKPEKDMYLTGYDETIHFLVIVSTMRSRSAAV